MKIAYFTKLSATFIHKPDSQTDTHLRAHEMFIKMISLSLAGWNELSSHSGQGCEMFMYDTKRFGMLRSGESAADMLNDLSANFVLLSSLSLSLL
jgi:hypothetical protein